jgi:hypothetical protein
MNKRRMTVDKLKRWQAILLSLFLTCLTLAIIFIVPYFVGVFVNIWLLSGYVTNIIGLWGLGLMCICLPSAIVLLLISILLWFNLLSK